MDAGLLLLFLRPLEGMAGSRLTASDKRREEANVHMRLVVGGYRSKADVAVRFWAGCMGQRTFGWRPWLAKAKDLHYAQPHQRADFGRLAGHGAIY